MVQKMLMVFFLYLVTVFLQINTAFLLFSYFTGGLGKFNTLMHLSALFSLLPILLIWVLKDWWEIKLSKSEFDIMEFFTPGTMMSYLMMVMVTDVFISTELSTSYPLDGSVYVGVFLSCIIYVLSSFFLKP